MASFNAILEFLGKKPLEGSLEIYPTDIDHQQPQSLMWAKNSEIASEVKTGVLLLTQEIFDQISKVEGVYYLIVEENPRLEYLRVIEEFFMEDREQELINDVERHRSAPDILIGSNVFIGLNVEIGAGTIIHDNCTIFRKSRIGKNCFIKSFSSIGTEGLGFELVDKKWVKFPQIGNVEVQDNCEIGPHSTIRRSALGTTVVGKGSKIGSFCNIGHNCQIGENVMMTSNCTLAGSSVIGDNCYLGVSSSIRNGITIGYNTTVGMGSVVVKNIPPESVVYGNPARSK